MFDVNSHLMDLKGKAYLQVMWRLVWFREEHPSWCIDTKLEHYDSEKAHAIFSAKIYDENGAQKSTGYGSESAKDFRDFLEKAETKAVGRALAMLGYGTQFAPELDEEERIVDSPVPYKAAGGDFSSQGVSYPNSEEKASTGDSGEFMPYCVECGQEISVRVHDFSVKKFKKPLCMDCQKKQ